MTPKAQFGRRGRAPAAKPASKPGAFAPGGSLDIKLTPEQRAFLLAGRDAPTHEPSQSSPGGEIAPWTRLSAFAASAAIACCVAALVLIGRPHQTNVGLTEALEPARKLLPDGAGGLFEPFSLAWSILLIASQLMFTLAATQKFCALTRLAGAPAFVLTGALLGATLGFISTATGLDELQLGAMAGGFSGAAAALLYWLLTGRARAMPFS
jgi:hypothetical protein